MKKFLSVTTLVLLSFLFVPNLTSAGGGLEAIELSKSKNSVVANGTDSIVVTARFWRWQCAGLDPRTNEPAQVVAAGRTNEQAQTDCNNATGNPTVTGKITATNLMFVVNLQLLFDGKLINPDNGDAYYQTGLAYFTLKSTTAGNKTIVAKASEQSYQYWAGFDTTSITFTAPATNTTTAAKPAVTAQTPSADPAAPAVPALTVLKVGGEEIKPEEAPQKQLQVGQPVVFSGKTIPNGKVTLTFHSDPFTDTVTADANGDWNYTLTKDLGTGDHTMTVAVTDPATNKTSDQSQPVAFTLVAGEKSEPVTAAGSSNQNWLWYAIGGGLALILALGGLLFFLIRKRNKSEKSEEPKATKEITE